MIHTVYIYINALYIYIDKEYHSGLFKDMSLLVSLF